MTLKIKSRLAKSIHLFKLVKKTFLCKFEKIHPLVLFSTYEAMTLKLKSTSPKPNQLLNLAQLHICMYPLAQSSKDILFTRI